MKRPVLGRSPRPRRRLPVGALVVAAALLAAALAWMSDRPTPPLRPDPAVTRTRTARPGPDAEPPSPLQPSPVPETLYGLEPPYTVYDAVTFGTVGATATRFVGVEGPGPESVCTARDGSLWACGLAARAALAGLVRARRIACRTQRPDDVPLRAVCTVDGRDIAADLVRAGFARPDRAGTALDDLSREARDAGRGLWAGGWTVRP